MKRFLLIVIILLLIVPAGLFLWRLVAGLNEGMNYPRSEIHAAVLGDEIYVAGGIGLFRVLDACERYDLTTQSWQACPPLPRPLHHVAMAADENRVYASGGYVALPFEQDQDAALFAHDPGSDQWQELAKLPNPIGQHAMVHHEGKLYLVGGQNGAVDLDTLWSFDIATGDWTAMPPMPTPRHSHAIAMDGDKLYVTGGRSAELGTEIAKVEMFDFASGSWSALPDMPTGRGGHGAFVRDGKLHVFGGETLSGNAVLASHEKLDLETGDWSADAAPLDKPRHGFAVGDVPGMGGVKVIGGGAHPAWQTIYSVSSTMQDLTP